MVMARLLFGMAFGVAGLGVLDGLGALGWGFPWTMLAMAPVLLPAGLIMGLHEEPPPWRRRRVAP